MFSAVTIMICYDHLFLGLCFPRCGILTSSHGTTYYILFSYLMRLLFDHLKSQSLLFLVYCIS